MKTYRRWISWLCVVAILTVMLPITALASTEVESGICGDNLTWVLNDEGTLTIGGEGEMEDYSSPWYGLGFSKVVIEDGVTSIGEWAFSDCTSLQTITIPDSVTSIGEEAFYGCDILTFYGIADSYAEEYANENGIPFVVLGDELNYTAGDVDGKGEVTASDALLALQESTGKVILQEVQMIAADVDGNSGVTVNDALLILQYATEKITSFPGARERGVSREEWLVALATAMDLEATTDEIYSFDDYTDAENASLIEAAIRAGYVELVADQDNMLYFDPSATATREFASVTTIRAFALESTGDELPQWNDIHELAYPDAAIAMVDFEIFSLVDNSFMAHKTVVVSELEKAITAFDEFNNSTNISDTPIEVIDYADEVRFTALDCSINQDSNEIFTMNEAAVSDWEAGQVYVLDNPSQGQNIAIKVTEVQEENGWTVINYEEPSLVEVVDSIEAEGSVEQGGYMTPASGVVFDDVPVSRAAHGTIPLFGKKTFTVNIQDHAVTGSVDLKDIEYRFDAGGTVWPPFIKINEVYLAVNAELTLEFDLASISTEDAIEPIKIADINCPVGAGFNISGELYFIFDAEAGLTVGVTVTSKTGIQYTKADWIRPIKEVDVALSPVSIGGNVETGLAIEPAAEFLGIDLVSVGLKLGAGLDGELVNMNAVPLEYCLDVDLYMFLTIYAQIGPDVFNLEYEKEIFNSDNSPLHKNWHFEETGKVDECTRGYGNYDGYVKDAETNEPIPQAKVQVYYGERLKDTTYTDFNGKFIGLNLPSGTYNLRVSASGYIPYEQSFYIIGGQTTVVETQLMIARDDNSSTPGGSSSASFTCSGIISNAYTGMPVDNAQIVVRSTYLFGDDTIVATVYSDENGEYSFNAPQGKYELVVTKDDFVTNIKYVTLSQNQFDTHIILNPSNQQSVAGDLRIVLRWGEEPSDLDSHLVGSSGDEYFHVCYWNMYSENASLDVDDTTSYGPETISITGVESGTYRYYVHDYSNLDKSYSTAMSESGAYLELYSGNTLMFTIHVPTEADGTLWHVFDYDGETGTIELINEFSYETEFSAGGGNVFA